MKSVYSAVQTGSLNELVCASSLVLSVTYHEPWFNLQLLSIVLYLPVNADQTQSTDVSVWSIYLAYFP
jgi:hypothetical protein